MLVVLLKKGPPGKPGRSFSRFTYTLAGMKNSINDIDITFKERIRRLYYKAYG
jgi:hypothetical protein